MFGQPHKTAPCEVAERVGAIDRRQTCDTAPATRHDDLETLLNTIEMLTEAVVQGPNANLLLITTM